jgi:hypothetical protein
MGSIKKSFHICGNQMRALAASPRLIVIFIFIILLLQSYELPVQSFSRAAGVKATPWILPFLLGSMNIQIYITMCVVVLFCDVPFISENTPYTLIRSGRNKWFIGQCLYILLTALCFVLFVVVMSMLLLVPNVELNAGWGKVWRTLAQTNAGMQFNIASIFTYDMQLMYAPITAMLLSGARLFLNTVFVGMLMFAISLFSSRTAAPVAGTLFAFLPVIADAANGYYMYYVSPASWMDISIINSQGASYYPTSMYAATFTALALILFGIIAYRKFRSKSIEVVAAF